MTDRKVNAYVKDTGEPVTVPWRWVDNPGIRAGRYVSKRPTKASRAKREEPVNPEATPDVADPIDTTTPSVDDTKE